MGRWFVGALAWLPAILLVSATTSASAQSPEFVLPVDCDMMRLCTVQSYMDHDRGPGAHDFTGGLLTYDGHQGTDLRLRDRNDMDAGVAVLAAAAGTVLRVRDGEIDSDAADAAIPADRMAGNGVVIDHGGGWHTQYSHLRQGSVLVAPGQAVAAGEAIGLVGQSGFADFPHLHFEVRRNNVTIDPFLQGSTTPEDADLWREEAARSLAYRGGGILDLGFAPTEPRMTGLARGIYDDGEYPSTINTLVAWVRLFGTRTGDELELGFFDPNGILVVGRRVIIKQNKAEQMFFVGRRKPDSDWQPGLYVLTVRFVRPEDTFPGRREDRTATLVVTP